MIDSSAGDPALLSASAHTAAVNSQEPNSRAPFSQILSSVLFFSLFWEHEHTAAIFVYVMTGNLTTNSDANKWPARYPDGELSNMLTNVSLSSNIYKPANTQTGGLPWKSRRRGPSLQRAHLFSS